jgi:hypothetical protein
VSAKSSRRARCRLCDGIVVYRARRFAWIHERHPFDDHPPIPGEELPAELPSWPGLAEHVDRPTP